jgi:hypothetical protein
MLALCILIIEFIPKSIVDRVSKFTLIKKVKSKHAEVVTEATIIMLQPIWIRP